MAATTTILQLPHELLEQIASYLDWDPTSSHTPSKPDVEKLSRTCRQIRQAVLPIHFRHVTLRLRWDEGALLEPKLFRLRREHGHLMKHVRCIYIRTQWGHYPSNHFHLPPLRVPETLLDWTDMREAEQQPKEQQTTRTQTHRQRVEDVARRMLNDPGFVDTLNHSPSRLHLREHVDAIMTKLFGNTEAMRSPPPLNDVQLGHDTSFDDHYEDALASPIPINLSTLTQTPSFGSRPRTVRGTEEARMLRVQLDTLVLVMLCFPPTVKSIILECQPRNNSDSRKASFAYQTASAAAEIFADRLDSLSILTTIQRDSIVSRTLPNPVLCNKLSALRTLILDFNGSRDSPAALKSTSYALHGWHELPPTLADLTISNLLIESASLVDFCSGFPSIKRLTLSRIDINRDPSMRRQIRQFQRGQAVDWLHFLILLRRAMPMPIFVINSPEGAGTEGLGASALKWLLEEAVPRGTDLSLERETRLVEDFDSFQLLWGGEDSKWGECARAERADGKLVDMAMSSRWRGLG